MTCGSFCFGPQHRQILRFYAVMDDINTPQFERRPGFGLFKQLWKVPWMAAATMLQMICIACIGLHFFGKVLWICLCMVCVTGPSLSCSSLLMTPWRFRNNIRWIAEGASDKRYETKPSDSTCILINTLASATFMRKSRGQSELKTMFCESFSWQGKVPDLLPARKATFWPIQGWRTTGAGTKEERVSWLWKGKCVTDAAVSTVLCAQVCAWSWIASEFYGASVAASL